MELYGLFNFNYCFLFDIHFKVKNLNLSITLWNCPSLIFDGSLGFGTIRPLEQILSSTVRLSLYIYTLQCIILLCLKTRLKVA